MSMSPAQFVLGIVLSMVLLSAAVGLGRLLASMVESRRWRSRYRVAAVESRRWRRDQGHPGGHAVYARDRDRKQGRRHA